MNRVYKVVFNHALGAWVAVSELTKSHKKRASATAVAVALVASMLSPFAEASTSASGAGVDSEDPAGGYEIPRKDDIQDSDGNDLRGLGFGLVVVDKEGKRKEIKEGVKIDDENTLDDDKKSTVITVEPNNDGDEKPPKSETSYLYLVEGKGVTIDQHGRSAKFSVNTGDGLKIDGNNKVAADTVELTVTDGKVTAPDEADKKKLVNAENLSNTLNELGWKVSANGGAASTVKSGDEVEFKGEGGVTVTSETDSTGKHIVTIKAAQPQGGTAAGGSTPVTAGNGISVSKDNKVSVNAKTGGGITVGADGVSVHAKTGGGITVDADGVSVNAKDKGGLTVGTDGVSVNTDGTTIAVDTATGKVSAVTGTITAGNKASVEDADKDKLAKAGEVADAINAAKTVVTNADNTTKVELDADGKTYKVAAKVADGKGLEKTDSGLAVKAGNGIEVGSDGVKVNAKTDGGIKVDATGVSVNAKTNGGLTVNGEGVSVNTDGATIAVDAATGKVSAVTGGFTTNTTTGATEAKTGDGNKLATVSNVASAINAAKVKVEAGNGADVSHNEATNTYTVSAKVESGKGLESGAAGLSVKAGDGVTVDNKGVSVKSKTNGGITVGTDGVSVQNGNGITVGADGVSVHTKDKGGLTVNGDGVSVDTDGTTIEVGTDGKVTAKVASDKGLEKTADGLAIKSKANGGITVDADGVSVTTDNTTIAVDKATGKVSAVTGTIENDAGKAKAKAGDEDKLTTVANVAKAINDAKVKVAAGNGADVSHNEATNTYTVSAKVEDNKGLESTDKGLAIKSKTNGGITVGADGVSVQNGNGITVDASGVSVKAKDKGGLTVGADGVSVHTKDKGGLTVNGDGISVDTDGTTIEVGTDGKVAAKVASDKGLEKTADGLAIKSKANGGITVDADGVSVVTDGKTINVADGKVSAVTGTIENEAGNAKAKTGDEAKLTTVANVVSAINEAKTKVAAKDNTTEVELDTDGKTYKVAAKVADGKGLEKTTNGLAVKQGSGITVDASGVSVNAKTDGGITVGADGISVHTKDKGGLTVGTDGVSVNTDGTTIKLDDTGNVSAVTGEIENNAGKAQAKDGDGNKLTTVANVAKAINDAKVKVVAGNGADVSHNEATNTYTVSAKVEDNKGLESTDKGLAIKSKTNGGITVGADGVSVQNGNGITVDASGVSVKAKDKGGLTVGTDGVSVNTDGTTIAVDTATGNVKAVTGEISNEAGNAKAKTGDEAKLTTVANVVSAINEAKTKVAAKDNTTEVELDTDGKTYKVAAKVADGKGLEKTNDGLAIKSKTNGGITVDADGVSVNAKTGGGITVDGSGVSVDTDNTTINVANGKVSAVTGTFSKDDKTGDTIAANGDGNKLATVSSVATAINAAKVKVEAGNGADVSHNEATNTYTVSAKVESGKGLESGAAGLSVKAGDGVTVNANGVSVNAKTDGGITVDANGVSVNAKNNGGIKVDGTGVSVDTDGTTIEVGTDGKVAAKVASDKGLEKTADGLAIKSKTNGGITVDADGVSVVTDGKTINVADGKVSAVTGTIENEAGKAKAKTGDEAKLTTVANVVSAINAAKTVVTNADNTTEVELDADGKTYKVAAKVADGKGLEKTDSGLAVKAGNSIEVGSDGVKVKVKDNGGIIVDKDGLSVDLPFTRTEEPDGTMVTFKGKPAADRPNGEVRIGGVAAGMVTPTSTDAVNGSQLYAVSSRVDRLQDKVDKLGKRADAGVAGALATANLLQPHHPGQSVATAAVGNHNGQTAIAVGYATMSDNGKYGMRFSFGANSQHDVSLGAGLGYFW